MASNLHAKPTVGFVSKALFQTLLLIGISSLAFCVVINSLADKPVMIAVNLVMMACYGFSLMLLNKVSIRASMRFGMFVTAIGIITIIMLDARGVIWISMIPLVSFALFGKKEGLPWILASLFFISTGLIVDAASLKPIYSPIEALIILLGYVVISLTAWFYVRHIEKSHDTILQETTEKERLKVAQNLAGGMAHLINNEMQGIIGTVELLQIDGCNHAIAADLERICELSVRASAHANQLLAYAQGGKYIIQSIDLKMLLTSLLKPWRLELPEQISLNVKWPVDKATCIGNPVQIGQLLIGLLENAKESIEERLHISAESDQKLSGQIEISFEIDLLEIESPSKNLSRGRYIKVSIEDNGCGMDKATCGRIFEPFFTTRFSGRGMGLAAAFGIIKNHHGHISVASQKGKGSLFQVWLPAEKEQ